jgi:hypothetical protein
LFGFEKLGTHTVTLDGDTYETNNQFYTAKLIPPPVKLTPKMRELNWVKRLSSYVTHSMLHRQLSTTTQSSPMPGTFSTLKLSKKIS